MKNHQRFIQSKCDRCGRATPAKQNGIGDLFVLPHEWGPPLADQGDFCAKCCKLPKANWLVWWGKHRT